MMKSLVLIASLTIGSSTGWMLGSPGGVMGSYLASVCGASIGLFYGRKLQKLL